VATKYPWDAWFGQGDWEMRRHERGTAFVRGYHYSCSLVGMVAQIRNQAMERRIQVHVKWNRNDGAIRIKVTGRTRAYKKRTAS
jgi:hypothetical protein